MKNTFIKYILLALAPPPPSIVDIDVIDVIKISQALPLRFDSGKAEEWYYSISLSVKTVLVMKKLTKLCCIPATFSAIWKWNRDYKIVMWIAGHHSLPYEYLAKQTLLLHLLKELSNCQLPGRDGRRWGRREGMGMKGRREKGREWGEENKGKSDCKREKNEWEGGRRVCATCRLTWSAFCDWSIFDLMESSSTSLFIDWAVSLSTCEKGHFIHTHTAKSEHSSMGMSFLLSSSMRMSFLLYSSMGMSFLLYSSMGMSSLLSSMGSSFLSGYTCTESDEMLDRGRKTRVSH